MQGIVKRQTIQDIADAIRFANGSTNTYTPTEMASAIKNLTIYDNNQFKQLLLHTVTNVDNSTITQIRQYAFFNCTQLSSINFPNVNYIGSYAFYNCAALTSVKLPNVWQIGANAFENCSKLQTVDIGEGSLYDGSINFGLQAFRYCSKLTTVIIRENTRAVGSSQLFESTPIASGTGYIYVPSDLYDSYVSNSSWSSYKSRFRVIEDYPDICG